YAAAANLSDHDFKAGLNHFTGSGGSLDNAGTIQASEAVELVGQLVSNRGRIVAPGGVVGLTAGSDVLLGQPGSAAYARVTHAPAISVSASNPATGGGDVYAIALRNTGS